MYQAGSIKALLAAMACAACVKGSAVPVTDPVSAVQQVAAPQIFAPGVISDGRWQWRLTFTPNEKTAYYTVSNEFFPATRQAAIMVTHRLSSGEWSTPEVAPFSGTYADIDPFISPDGQRLYFSSIRPVDGVAKPDLDIFVMHRTADGWSEPVRLSSNVNSPLDELYPSQSANGALYFASGPLGPTAAADWNIYTAQRAGDDFAPRQAIAELNTDLPYDSTNPTADWEFNPEISVDGKTLVFTSLRPGGYGFGDLYVSHNVDGRWSAPANLGPAVNTANDEFHPTLSRNGRTLYFARTIFTPSLTPSDFYSVSVGALPR